MNGWLWRVPVGALVFLGIVGAPRPAPAQVRFLEMAGARAEIGVTVRDADTDGTTKAGVIVDEVTKGSPAEKAGVKTGDAVAEFDGERIRSARQFSRVVQETVPGRSIQAVLVRGDQRVTVTLVPQRAEYDDDFGLRLLDRVRPAMPPMPPTPPAAPRPPTDRFDYFLAPGPRRLGVTLETLDDQLAGYFGVKEGVLVKSIEEGSAAATAGLKAGDVITGLNGRHIYDVSDVQRALGRPEANGDLSIEIVRDRKTQTLKGKLEDTARTRTRTP